MPTILSPAPSIFSTTPGDTNALEIRHANRVITVNPVGGSCRVSFVGTEGATIASDFISIPDTGFGEIEVRGSSFFVAVDAPGTVLNILSEV